MKHDYGIDIPVLLVFFCRDVQFKQVFEQVKKARPRRLFLYQDGAREGRADDIRGIEKCRQIAEDIDWECEVHKFYQERNVGCDPSVFIAIKWAFSNVDKCIILEDDVVPSQSFFRFCKELLDYYENDERIHIICGMNNNDVTENIDESYLFTTKGSIWGWATWKRVIDTWDETYSFLEDPKILKRIEENSDNKGEYSSFINACKRHKTSGRAHHESINGASRRLYNRINIVPKYNMISNVGVGEETTHGANDIRKYPKRIRRLFYKKVYDIDFPLKHPQYILRNKEFEKKMTLNKCERVLTKIEGIALKIRYDGIKGVIKTVQNKLSRRNNRRK